jgi:hypothetical protein
MLVVSNEVLLVEPWVDYNSKPRVAILEINGVSAPVGTWGPPDARGEYVPPTQPVGEPWDRVLSWDKQWLALGAGDYAVVALQFRLGDGDACIDYPEVMRRTFGMQLRGILLDTTSTTPGWPAAARVEWNDPSSIIARMRNPVAAALAAMVMWDFSFLDEYYKPVRRCLEFTPLLADRASRSFSSRMRTSSRRRGSGRVQSTSTT